MKKDLIFLMITALCMLTVVSCKRAREGDSGTPADNVEVLITENEGEYPRDFDLFGDNSVNTRLQALLGDDFDTIKANFETQTPVVSEDHVYKFTGCKAHDCPGFLTRIYYDAEHDNFNVLVTQSGKVKVYTEKGQIRVPKVLEVK